MIDVVDREVEKPLVRLRIDAGQRTLAELIADREIAAMTIERMRSHVQRLAPERRAVMIAKVAAPVSSAAQTRSRVPGMLLKMKDIREYIGASNSTIYGWIKEGSFPAPIRMGSKMSRWRIEDVDAWRATLENSNA